MATKPTYEGGDRRAHDDEAECHERHERWFEASMAPKVRMLILTTISGAAVVATGAVIYISKNVVKDHAFEERMVFETTAGHEKDVSKIEQRLDRMETNLASSMQSVSDKLDRNLRALERRQ